MAELSRMKIIAGRLRGRSLLCPEGLASRPPLALLRRIMFDSLWLDLEGAQVLDLFAGSGSIGLEAISRGAKECVFVEESPGACAVIKKNLDQFAIEGAIVLRGSYPQVLEGGSLRGRRFHCVFVDPPFEQMLAGSYPDLLGRCAGLLVKGGVLVVRSPESSAQESHDAEKIRKGEDEEIPETREGLGPDREPEAAPLPGDSGQARAPSPDPVCPGLELVKTKHHGRSVMRFYQALGLAG